MSAPTSTDHDLNPTTFAAQIGRPKYGAFAAPPCPLPPDLRSDVAARRAEGHTWDQVGVALRYDADALRRACEDDPDYEPAERKAFDAARRSVEAEALQRLRGLMRSENERVAKEAAAVVVRYGAECREYEARERAEQTRAETARLKVYAQKPHLWADAPPRPPALPIDRPGFAERFKPQPKRPLLYPTDSPLGPRTPAPATADAPPERNPPAG